MKESEEMIFEEDNNDAEAIREIIVERLEKMQ
jgi:hypothetical protein